MDCVNFVSQFRSFSQKINNSKTRFWLSLCFLSLSLIFFGPANAKQLAAKGQLLIKHRSGLTVEGLKKIVHRHGGKIKNRLYKSNIFTISVPDNADLEAVSKALEKDRNIEMAQPDYIYAIDPDMIRESLSPKQMRKKFSSSLIPDDTNFGSAWHHLNIGAPTAWDLSTGAEIIIAILDSGVNAAHPDLSAHMVPGWNWYDNNDDTTDVYGHGTMVAGSAAAVGNNALGVTGVAMNSMIMPIRVTSTSGYAYSSAIVNGIHWAADHGARVANLSFQNAAGNSMIISAAEYMRSLGGVVIAAGGNTGGELPLKISDQITVVSSINSMDTISTFSSWGNFIDLAAPGQAIWTTTRSGGYGMVSGTSFSSPITAAVYALMMAVNPKLPPETLDQILFSTAVDRGVEGRDVRYGHGRVDAAAAVAEASKTRIADTKAPTVSIAAPISVQVSGLVTIDVIASDDSGIARVDLIINDQFFSSSSTSPFGFSWDSNSQLDGDDVTLVAVAYDWAGNMASSEPINVKVMNDFDPPTVTINSPANEDSFSGVVDVSVSASDDKGISSIVLLINGKEVASSAGETLDYSWSPNENDWQFFPISTIEAIATDKAGKTSSVIVTVHLVRFFVE